MYGKLLGKRKRKRKAKCKEDEAFETQFAAAEGKCIQGTMKDKTMDLLQVCFAVHENQLYICLTFDHL